MADLSIDFIGRQLQNIQAELREMKFAAEVERRNNRSALDNLVAEVGVKLGTFEAMIEHRLEAIDQQVGAVQQQLDQRLGTVQQQLDRIEQLLTPRGSPS
jgi:deoxyribodipyrimidine photolyase